LTQLTYTESGNTFDKAGIYIILFVTVIAISIGCLIALLPADLVFVIIAASFLIVGLIHKRFLITFAVFGLILFSRGFAHLNVKIGILPVYVTEAVLMITIGGLFLDRLIAGDKISYFQKIPLKKEFIFFYLIGFICLVRGLLLYSPVLTLRHSAIIYYSVFYFLMPILFNTLEKIEKLLKLIFVACLIITMATLLKVKLQINEYGALGDYNHLYLCLAIIFETFYCISLKKKIDKIFIILVVILHLLAVLINQNRASWVALFVSFLFIFYLSIKKVGKLDRKIIKVSSFILLAGIISICSVGFAKPTLFSDLGQEAASVIFFNRMGTRSAGTARYRLAIWHEMLKDISSKPVLGWGFGKAFLPALLEERGWLSSAAKERAWVDPHNSILDLTYKTGIIGLFAFVLIMMKFFCRTMRFIRTCRDKKIKLYIMALLVCFLFVLVLAFFEVVLEGAFRGAFLWITMGLVVALENIYRENELQDEYVWAEGYNNATI